jgi:hypothetical protein
MEGIAQLPVVRVCMPSRGRSEHLTMDASFGLAALLLLCCRACSTAGTGGWALWRGALRSLSICF